jgi:hypothetical protein
MLLPAPRRYHGYFKKRQLTQWAAQRVDRILTVMHRMQMLDDEAFALARAEQLWGKPVDTRDASDPGFAGDEDDEGFVRSRIGELNSKPSDSSKDVDPLGTLPLEAPTLEPLEESVQRSEPMEVSEPFDSKIDP